MPDLQRAGHLTARPREDLHALQGAEGGTEAMTVRASIEVEVRANVSDDEVLAALVKAAQKLEGEVAMEVDRRRQGGVEVRASVRMSR